jgi:hypothetical protein
MEATILEGLASQTARRMAARISRRSFVGRAGLGLVAASMGGAGTALLFPEVAEAHTCPSGCNCSESVTCVALTGVNGCPSGTCECGCWTVSDCTRCPGQPNCVKSWCDCCGGTYCNPHPCHCVAAIRAVATTRCIRVAAEF